MPQRALPPAGMLVIDNPEWSCAIGTVVTPNPAERRLGIEKLRSDFDLCVLVEWRPFPEYRIGGRRWEYAEDLSVPPARGADGPCTHCGCSDAECGQRRAATRYLCCRACSLFNTHPIALRAGYADHNDPKEAR